MSTLISHMKEPKACVSCGVLFKPITRWQEFCTPDHRYAYTESVKQLGYAYLGTIKGKGEFMELLKIKLVEVDEKAGRKVEQQTEREKERQAELEKKEKEIKATTWGEWIDSNFETKEQKEAFIKENQGTTFMSPFQRLGETYDDFLARAAEEKDES